MNHGLDMNHGLTSSCLTVLLLAVAPEPAADAETERYSTLAFRETPLADFRGVIPLTPEQARARNHYVFRRDARGRLTELSFRLGDDLRPINHSANHFFRAPLIRIRHGRRTEVRSFFGSHGHRILVDEAVFEEHHELDASGRRIGLRYLGRDDRPVENRWGIHSYRWRHEPDGSVIEWRKDLDGRSVDMRPHLAFRVVRFVYREDGLLDRMQNLDRDGRLVNNDTGVAEDRLSYRPNGTFAGWAVFDASGRPARGNHPNVSRGLVTVDRWGLESTTRFEDEVGAAIRNARGWAVGRTEYDRFGNWSRRAFFDEKGRPLVVPELGYHRYVFTWSADGRLPLTRWYEDTEGRRVPHGRRGFSGVVHAHGSGSGPTTSRFLDARGKPVARTDTGVAEIESCRDGDGRLVAACFLDLEGRLVDDRVRGHAVVEHPRDRAGLPLPSRRLTAAEAAVESVTRSDERCAPLPCRCHHRRVDRRHRTTTPSR